MSIGDWRAIIKLWSLDVVTFKKVLPILWLEPVGPKQEQLLERRWKLQHPDISRCENKSAHSKNISFFSSSDNLCLEMSLAGAWISAVLWLVRALERISQSRNIRPLCDVRKDSQRIQYHKFRWSCCWWWRSGTTCALTLLMSRCGGEVVTMALAVFALAGWW